MKEIASQALRQNIIHLNEGDFLTAGRNQFQSFWTRDFCFSVPALLTLKEYSIVKNQLDFLIKNRNANNLIPIYADSVNPMLRVLAASFNQIVGTSIRFKHLKRIKPFYSANAKFSTIDANLLTLKASYDYYKATNDVDWWNSNQKEFLEIFNYYNSFLDDGLISQGPFSDWQDSSKRNGKTFFTNLLYLEVSKDFQFIEPKEIVNLTKKITKTFFDPTTGLYLSIEGSNYISLEGILWAIEKDSFHNSNELYERLKVHQLWLKNTIPGFVTFPSYQKNWLITHVKLSGMNEYHGNISWSWLMAYSALISYKLGDKLEGDRISQILNRIIMRDKTICEIYFSDKDYEPYHTFLYKSESPFSWGAAFVIQMIESKKAAQN